MNVMPRIFLGKTSIKIHRMGFGGIPIQRVGEKEAIATVRHAIEQGVDFIDTARGYTTSEERIGKALQASGAKVAIASKSHNRTADGIRKDIEISLDNLQREKIELYQCHFVKDENDYQQIVGPNGALEGLIQAREEGLIQHIGLSSHSLDLLLKVLDDDLFETIMLCFSFLEPAAREKVIPQALANNVGIIGMKPFSGGVLDNPELALKFVLAQTGVVTIPGIESIDLFDANWTVYQGCYDLSSAEQRKIKAICRQYDKLFCRRCDYCQPCSEDIPIQTILGLRYMAKRFGPSFLKREWVKEAVTKAQNCSGCRECMARCPYELEIPDLIKTNLRWLGEDQLT
ncbi:MAG: aldo/keto reductase [Desulfobacterales bacterium]|nr:aldo/keto reductase [Desulfobacterales bacterium]